MINKTWHEANRMPKNPTEAERAAWHHAHLEHCGCRKPTPAIQALLKKYQAEKPLS